MKAHCTLALALTIGTSTVSFPANGMAAPEYVTTLGTDSLRSSIALPSERLESSPMPPAYLPGEEGSHQKLSNTLWIKQLINNGFHINDPNVDYPKFPRFCRNVYNWGDRLFNSYDPEYVVGTGKNWKLQAKSYNWLEAITMEFPDSRIWMHTHLYADAGLSISFMALSLSYMFNVNELLGTPTHRSTFQMDFTCSRFTLWLKQQNCKGDMTITELGSYKDGKHVDIPFDDADIYSFYVDGYYFFNNRKYSHAAAYCQSKYQLKSAGTWIAGFAYDHKNIKLDFSKLKLDVPESTAPLLREYHFNYRDYQLAGGYAYNWAIVPPRWVLNATGLLAMGYRRNHVVGEDSESMVSNSAKVNLAATYNHRALFATANAKFLGSLFYTSKYIFFNYNFSFSVNIGMRF